ncbi:hypothetical protein SNE40_000426 [Patella caerulea]|uniref:Alpha/beta hydrolase fold-3 domain-containing protein n=1 Tax=Patella caerulea TaxID=87958 RepID=A0AAN8Q9Z6_PATCE
MGLFSCRNIGIFWSCIILGVSYFLYTPVPDGFAEPWKLRTVLASFKVVGLLGAISEKLGYDSSLNVTRKLAKLALGSEIFSKNDPELEVKDTLFDGVPVRIYKPVNIKTPAAGLVFYHGGGWVMLSVDTYDIFTSFLAKKANIIVISVEYRLAPEHPFPIPFDDCVTATLHLLQNSEKYGVDPTRVAIGGDSAGGNLAAAVSQRLAIEPESFVSKPKLQLLIYPCLQATDFNLPSYLQNNGMGGALTKRMMIRFWMNYIGLKNVSVDDYYFFNNFHTTSFVKQSEYGAYTNVKLLPANIQNQALKFENRDEDTNYELAAKIEDTILNPYFAPLMAQDLSKAPPAYIMNAEFDVLRDDGLLYGERLRQAGVRVHEHNVRHAFHGFITPIGPSETLRYKLGLKVLDEICQYLKRKL